MGLLLLNGKDHKHVISGNADPAYIIDYINAYKKDQKTIGAFRTEVATEYLGELYADIILSGALPANDAIKKAVKLYKWRKANQGSKWWPYFWDEEAAMDYINWTETSLTHKGEPNVLQANEHFRYGQIFGWRDTNGKRVIKSVFELMGRSNKKTVGQLQLFLYQMFRSGDKELDGMLMAGVGEATKKIFSNLESIVTNSVDEVRERIIVTDKYISFNKPMQELGYLSNMQVSPTTEKSSHGLKLGYILVDEVHTLNNEHNEIFENLKRSQQKAYSTPLIAYTSTRSIQRSDVLEEMIEEGYDLLENPNQVEGLKSLYYIYDFDNPNQRKSFDNWVMANPNIAARDVGAIEFLIEEYLAAEKNKDAKKSKIFYTTQFNIQGIEDTESFITQDELNKNNQYFNVKDIGKKPEAYIGVDLGSVDDFTAIVALIPKEIDGKYSILVESKSFITHDNFNKKKASGNYPEIEDWERNGQLVLMDDVRVNEAEIDTYLDELLNKYSVKMVGYDAKMASEFVARWQGTKYGDLFRSISQERRHTNEATRKIKNHFVYKAVIYNQDPLMRYYLSNAQLNKNERTDNSWKIERKTNKKGTIKDAKIDGADALITAYRAFLIDGGFAKVAISKRKKKYVPLTKLYE